MKNMKNKKVIIIRSYKEYVESNITDDDFELIFDMALLYHSYYVLSVK